jgi:hypothetical protein
MDGGIDRTTIHFYHCKAEANSLFGLVAGYRREHHTTANGPTRSRPITLFLPEGVDDFFARTAG